VVCEPGDVQVLIRVLTPFAGIPWHDWDRGFALAGGSKE